MGKRSWDRDALPYRFEELFFTLLGAISLVLLALGVSVAAGALIYYAPVFGVPIVLAVLVVWWFLYRAI